MKPGTKVTITTPPFFGSMASTSSGTFLGTLHRARAEECEKMIGASVTASASFMVSGDTWLRSTSMPRRFISRTTSSPNFESPLCRGWSVAESTHGTLAEWARVM